MKIKLNDFTHRYGPYALVTGASEGIGEAFAENLAKSGINVVLVARREDVLHKLAARLESQYGVLCPVVGVDLSKSEEIDKMFRITDALEIGLVVCNAGFGTAGNFLDSDFEIEMNMLNVNCVALTKMTYHMGRKLKARGRGGLILLSSILAMQGVPRSAHYSATKAYVHALAEALQEEWKKTGVDLLITAPGPVATGFASRSKMEIGKAASPAVVAKESLAAIGHQKVIYPGWLAKLMAFSLSTAPRSVRIKIMGAIMRNMTKKLP